MNWSRHFSLNSIACNMYPERQGKQWIFGSKAQRYPLGNCSINLETIGIRNSGPMGFWFIYTLSCQFPIRTCRSASAVSIQFSLQGGAKRTVICLIYVRPSRPGRKLIIPDKSSIYTGVQANSLPFKVILIFTHGTGSYIIDTRHIHLGYWLLLMICTTKRARLLLFPRPFEALLTIFFSHILAGAVFLVNRGWFIGLGMQRLTGWNAAKSDKFTGQFWHHCYVLIHKRSSKHLKVFSI